MKRCVTDVDDVDDVDAGLAACRKQKILLQQHTYRAHDFF